MTQNEMRLVNATAQVEKIGKTLERHHKTLAKKEAALSEAKGEHEIYWARCDVHSAQEAISDNEKKLAQAKANVVKYTEAVKVETEKNNVPMVPSVEKFLDSWKQSYITFYKGQVEAYRNARAALSEKQKATPPADKKERIAQAEERNALDIKFGVMVMHFSSYGCDSDARIETEAERERKNKRIDLYHRCMAVVGPITDASNLREGDNGSINGCVIGEAGKAWVETITAGGYNIQCLHYRVLVQPMK